MFTTGSVSRIGDRPSRTIWMMLRFRRLDKDSPLFQSMSCHRNDRVSLGVQSPQRANATITGTCDTRFGIVEKYLSSKANSRTSWQILGQALVVFPRLRELAPTRYPRQRPSNKVPIRDPFPGIKPRIGSPCRIYYGSHGQAVVLHNHAMAQSHCRQVQYRVPYLFVGLAVQRSKALRIHTESYGLLSRSQSTSR